MNNHDIKYPLLHGGGQGFESPRLHFGIEGLQVKGEKRKEVTALMQLHSRPNRFSWSSHSLLATLFSLPKRKEPAPASVSHSQLTSRRWPVRSCWVPI